MSVINMASLIAIPCLVIGLVGISQAREFQLLNNFGQVLWIGIQGNNGKAPLEGGGLVLNPGQRISTHTADNWEGRFWARTGCDARSQHCQTGDCGNSLKCNGRGGVPPVSLVEITLTPRQDWYDVSLVDGFNIPISIEPLGGRGDGSRYSCKLSQCRTNINAVCPNALRQKIGDQTVACKSACERFQTDQYCCRNAHNRPETCRSSDWPVNYPAFFKERCPDAYSYAYDDHKSTFTCQAPAYLVTFG